MKVSPCSLRVTCFSGSIIHEQSHNKLLLVSFKAPSKLVKIILCYFSPAIYNSFLTKTHEKRKEKKKKEKEGVKEQKPFGV